MPIKALYHTKLSTPASQIVCLGLFLLIVYLPLILGAGISVDDWGDIAHNLECTSFWHCYGTWFPLFSNRPLAPLPITLLTFILGTWYGGYLLINTLIYLAAIIVCAKVITAIMNLRSAALFILFCAIPMIAMPVITSPINQSTATVSFLLWALSLLSLWRFLQSGKVQYWFWTYFVLLLAFLTYEVILPLLALTILLPWISDAKKYRVLSIRYAMQFVVPMMTVLAIVTLWQKGIAPQFMAVDSRLKFAPSHALAKIYTFLHVFYQQIPTLFAKMPSYIGWGGLLTAITGLTAFSIAQQTSFTKFAKGADTSRSWRFFIVATLCLLSSSLIFILSDESAVSGGYEARGLSSTWFAFALVLAAIASLSTAVQPLWNKSITTVLAGFLVMCILCFSIQREQTIAAWKMQLMILADANQQIRTLNPPDGSVVLGDVPYYLPNNYNNEIVFSQPWDFGAALAITNNNRFVAGPVIDASRGRWNQLRLANNRVQAQNFSGATLDQFWVYQFDAKKMQGSLTRIETPSQFLQLYPIAGAL